MKLIKLTVLASLLFSSMTLFISCEPDAEQKRISDFEKKGIILTGAQETPANASTALGTMDVFYTRDTRVLTYSVTWSGLTGPVTAMHIHGLATAGFAAPVFQNIITSSGGIVTPGAAYGATSKISASLFIDGVTIKEQDLLNGNFYMNIHTAAYSGGEIRGQIRFQ
ncbi:MAG: CHRD domain-containing protein [Chitinophagaceae bacterium]